MHRVRIFHLNARVDNSIYYLTSKNVFGQWAVGMDGIKNKYGITFSKLWHIRNERWETSTHE